MNVIELQGRNSGHANVCIRYTTWDGEEKELLLERVYVDYIQVIPTTGYLYPVTYTNNETD